MKPKYVNVKESVFPFAKFSGVDPILGPGNDGEVMGIGRTFDEALQKLRLRQASASLQVVRRLSVYVMLISRAIELAKSLRQQGF